MVIKYYNFFFHYSGPWGPILKEFSDVILEFSIFILSCKYSNGIFSLRTGLWKSLEKQFKNIFILIPMWVRNKDKLSVRIKYFKIVFKHKWVHIIYTSKYTTPYYIHITSVITDQLVNIFTIFITLNENR